MKKEEKNKNSLKSIMIIILYFIFPYLMKFLSGIKWLTLLFYMLFVLLIISEAAAFVNVTTNNLSI